VSRIGLVVVALACAACRSSLGTVALVGRSADPVAVKLLRPSVTGRTCHTSWFGIFGEPAEPTIPDAAGTIYALDDEGDVLTDVTVRRSAIVTGVYNRRCVEVEANLGRAIRTVVIPTPPGHHGHH
jgi:hypothetical protein